MNAAVANRATTVTNKNQYAWRVGAERGRSEVSLLVLRCNLRFHPDQEQRGQR